jgi:hypothetical protein
MIGTCFLVDIRFIGMPKDIKINAKQLFLSVFVCR